MCTNKSSLDLVTLMDKYNVDELRDNNDFIEIISQNDGTWVRECYSRTELQNMSNHWFNTNTFWMDGEADNRVKAVYKLPWTGEFITEDSYRLLLLSHFNTFYKQDCGPRKIGTYFVMSALHGSEENVCKLIPLIRNDDGSNDHVINASLPRIPDNISEEDISEQEYQKLLQEEYKKGDDKIVEEKKEETEQEKKERRALEMERVKSKIAVKYSYNPSNFPKETISYKLDRVVNYNLENNVFDLKEWLKNNGIESIYSKLSPIITNLWELQNYNNPAPLVELGIPEEDVKFMVTKALFDVIDYDYRYNHCFTITERPDVSTTYYEKFCFQNNLTPNQLFFEMPAKRIETRGFNNINGYENVYTKLYTHNLNFMLFNFVHKNIKFTFILEQSDEKYICLVAYNINNQMVIKEIGSMDRIISSTLIVNQYTKEQFLRTCALVFFMLSDAVDNPSSETLTLIKLLSMGINKRELLNVYYSYIELLHQQGEQDVFSLVLKFFKNTPIHDVLGEYDDNYSIIKNMFMLLLIKFIAFDKIYSDNPDEEVILNITMKALGSLYVDDNKNNLLNFVLMNETLSAKEIILLLDYINTNYNVSFDTENNLYSAMIKYIDPKDYVEIADYLYSKNQDPTVDVDNLSILHRACVKGDKALKFVNWLISKGADLKRDGEISNTISNPLEMVTNLYYNDYLPESKKLIQLLKNKGATIEKTPYETLKKDNQGNILELVYDINYITANIDSEEELIFVLDYVKYMSDVNTTFRGYNLLFSYLSSSYSNSVDENNIEEFNQYIDNTIKYLDLLSSKGFDYTAKSPTGETPFLFSIKKELPSQVSVQILSKDISVSNIGDNEKTPLQLCIEKGDEYLEIVTDIIDNDWKEAFRTFQVDEQTFNAISYAKYNIERWDESKDIYDYLLIAFEDDYDILYKLNNPTEEGGIKISDRKFKELFLENITVEKLRNYFVTSETGENTIISIVNCLYANPFENMINWRIFKQMLTFYLNQGGDINYKDSYGCTALNYALSKGYPLFVIKFFIEKGANVNNRCMNKFPLDIALEKNNVIDYQSVVNLLSSKGARKSEVEQKEERDYNDHEEDNDLFAEDERYFQHMEEDEEEEENSNNITGRSEQRQQGVRRRLF